MLRDINEERGEERRGIDDTNTAQRVCYIMLTIYCNKAIGEIHDNKGLCEFGPLRKAMRKHFFLHRGPRLRKKKKGFKKYVEKLSISQCEILILYYLFIYICKEKTFQFAGFLKLLPEKQMSSSV